MKIENNNQSTKISEILLQNDKITSDESQAASENNKLKEEIKKITDDLTEKKELIENAENLQKRIKSENLSEEEFESLFLRSFKISIN